MDNSFKSFKKSSCSTTKIKGLRQKFSNCMCNDIQIEIKGPTDLCKIIQNVLTFLFPHGIKLNITSTIPIYNGLTQIKHEVYATPVPEKYNEIRPICPLKLTNYFNSNLNYHALSYLNIKTAIKSDPGKYLSHASSLTSTICNPFEPKSPNIYLENTISPSFVHSLRANHNATESPIKFSQHNNGIMNSTEANFMENVEQQTSCCDDNTLFTIDDRALLFPVDIENSPSYFKQFFHNHQSSNRIVSAGHHDSEHERLIQTTIDQYFTSKIYLPSPYPSNQSKTSNSLPKKSKDLFLVKTRNKGCQTIVSIPPLQDMTGMFDTRFQNGFMHNCSLCADQLDPLALSPPEYLQRSLFNTNNTASKRNRYLLFGGQQSASSEKRLLHLSAKKIMPTYGNANADNNDISHFQASTSQACQTPSSPSSLSSARLLEIMLEEHHIPDSYFASLRKRDKALLGSSSPFQCPHCNTVCDNNSNFASSSRVKMVATTPRNKVCQFCRHLTTQSRSKQSIRNNSDTPFSLTPLSTQKITSSPFQQQQGEEKSMMKLSGQKLLLLSTSLRKKQQHLTNLDSLIPRTSESTNNTNNNLNNKAHNFLFLNNEDEYFPNSRVRFARQRTMSPPPEFKLSELKSPILSPIKRDVEDNEEFKPIMSKIGICANSTNNHVNTNNSFDSGLCNSLPSSNTGEISGNHPFEGVNLLIRNGIRETYNSDDIISNEKEKVFKDLRQYLTEEKSIPYPMPQMFSASVDGANDILLASHKVPSPAAEEEVQDSALCDSNLTGSFQQILPATTAVVVFSQPTSNFISSHNNIMMPNVENLVVETPNFIPTSTMLKEEIIMCNKSLAPIPENMNEQLDCNGNDSSLNTSYISESDLSQQMSSLSVSCDEDQNMSHPSYYPDKMNNMENDDKNTDFSITNSMMSVVMSPLASNYDRNHQIIREQKQQQPFQCISNFAIENKIKRRHFTNNPHSDDEFEISDHLNIIPSTTLNPKLPTTNCVWEERDHHMGKELTESNQAFESINQQDHIDFATYFGKSPYISCFKDATTKKF